MKVILLQDVKGLGNRGDVKEATDGYVRNFLLPRNLACLINDPRAREIVQEKLSHRGLEKQEKSVLKEWIAKLDGQTFTFRAKADKNGHLYGSIGPKELAEKIGVKESLITEHFKKLGTFPLELKIDPGNSARINIVVDRMQ